MTPKERAVMQQALEALENAPVKYDFHGNPVDVEFGQQLYKAINAVREALAEQAEQEPVAKTIEEVTNTGYVYIKALTRKIPFGTDLYAAPVRTKDLTDAEIEAVFRAIHMKESWSLDFARAVIAADREKNK